MRQWQSDGFSRATPHGRRRAARPAAPAVTVRNAAATPPSTLDCQALANAGFDLNSSEPLLVILAGAGGSVVNRVDSSVYVDTTKLRADLDVLAALPDPTDATEIAIMGKPSEAIPQFRQLLDLIDAGAASEATPGPTPAGSDQQLLAFSSKFIQMSTALSAALAKSCPNTAPDVAQAQPPGAPPTPLTAGYQIGQTASVGDLRVTLDRVATLAGDGSILAAPGNRFVFVYITVKNTGPNPFQLNTLTGTYWEDTTGKQYFSDPYSITLDPAATNLEGQIPPGARQSGSVGYQLPRDPGDLIWVFQDFKPNQAVFAVKASDVAEVGTPVTEPTAEVLRSSAAATQTAFVELLVGADATNEAAGTETPVPEEPTETAAPPEPTEVPAVPVTDDTPTSGP